MHNSFQQLNHEPVKDAQPDMPVLQSRSPLFFGKFSDSILDRNVQAPLGTGPRPVLPYCIAANKGR